MPNSSIIGKGECTIYNLAGWIMATAPHKDGLYEVLHGASDCANVASTKMLINKEHHKLGHIGHAAICHAVSKGLITGINLDMDLKPEFHKPCKKRKVTAVSYQKMSDI